MARTLFWHLPGGSQLLWLTSSLNTELSCKLLQKDGSWVSGRGGQISDLLGPCGLRASRLGKKNKEEGETGWLFEGECLPSKIILAINQDDALGGT